MRFDREWINCSRPILEFNTSNARSIVLDDLSMLVSNKALTGVLLLAASANVAWAQTTEIQTRPVTAQVETTTTQTEPTTSESSVLRGILVPEKDIKMSSPFEALVRKVHVQAGQRVRRGQKLVSFDCDVIRSELVSAEARLAQRRLSHATNEKLYNATALSKTEFELSQSRIAESEAEVNTASLRLRSCDLTAPFSGIVSDVSVREFAHVVTGEPLLVLLDDSSLDLVVHVPSDWLRNKLVGKRLKVTVQETGDVHEAKIKQIWPAVDANSRTVKVSARLQGRHPQLFSGMTADAELLGQ